ncbi:MAG: glycoside hydrolase family 125 protein [Asticcacaulis sp.]|nr:glycoside hydrolase family 125 protein [Asticcacaulis sp.]
MTFRTQQRKTDPALIVYAQSDLLERNDAAGRPQRADQKGRSIPASGLGFDAAFRTTCTDLADEIGTAAAQYGKHRLPDGTMVWAYEADGFGNTLFMDDANVPNVLARPISISARPPIRPIRPHTPPSGATPILTS